jgi:hypothetical protein
MELNGRPKYFSSLFVVALFSASAVGFNALIRKDASENANRSRVFQTAGHDVGGALQAALPEVDAVNTSTETSPFFETPTLTETIPVNTIPVDTVPTPIVDVGPSATNNGPETATSNSTDSQEPTPIATSAVDSATQAAVPESSAVCQPISNARPPDSEFQEAIVVYEVLKNGVPNLATQTTITVHQTRSHDRYSYVTSSKYSWKEWRLVDGVTYFGRDRNSDRVVSSSNNWPSRSQPPAEATFRFPDFNVDAVALHETPDSEGNCHYQAEVGPVLIDDPQGPRSRWKTTVNQAGELVAIEETSAAGEFRHRYTFSTLPGNDISAPPCPRLEAGLSPSDTEPFLCGAQSPTTTVPKEPSVAMTDAEVAWADTIISPNARIDPNRAANLKRCGDIADFAPPQGAFRMMQSVQRMYLDDVFDGNNVAYVYRRSETPGDFELISAQNSSRSVQRKVNGLTLARYNNNTDWDFVWDDSLGPPGSEPLKQMNLSSYASSGTYHGVGWVEGNSTCVYRRVTPAGNDPVRNPQTFVDSFVDSSGAMIAQLKTFSTAPNIEFRISHRFSVVEPFVLEQPPCPRLAEIKKYLSSSNSNCTKAPRGAGSGFHVVGQ